MSNGVSVMGATMKTLTKIFLSAAVIACFATGCGTGTSNDQGTTFTLLGFFSAPPGDACEEIPAGTASLVVPISTSTGSGITGNNEFLGLDSAILTYLGLQNNLSGEFIRSQRAFFEYYIEGSSSQPPMTSYPLSSIVGPFAESGDTTDTDAFDSSLPNSFAGTCNRSYIQVPVIHPDVRTWMNFNRTSLPEPPFTMSATVYVSGLSSSGNRFHTQQEVLAIDITPDNVIPPTVGGGGLGGDTAGVTTSEVGGSLEDRSEADETISDVDFGTDTEEGLTTEE